MPPRYAYWTIIVDDQPTAFRAGAQEDLMPTFKRLKEKHAVGDDDVVSERQAVAVADRRAGSDARARRDGPPRRRAAGRIAISRSRAQTDARASAWNAQRPPAAQGSGGQASSGPESAEKLDWKPKGEFTPAPKRSERARVETESGSVAPETSNRASPIGSRRARSIAIANARVEAEGAIASRAAGTESRRLEAERFIRSRAQARVEAEACSGSRRARSIGPQTR